MGPLRGLGWGGSLYVLAVIVAAGVMVPLGWSLHPIQPDMIAQLLFLAAFTQVAALMPIRWSRGLLTVDTLPLVAAGLLLPGAGVALIAWLCTFDGRRPSAEVPLWRLVSTRAKAALEHGSASLLVAAIPATGWLALPLKTTAYALISLVLTYAMVARMFAFLERLPFREVLMVGLRQTSVQSVFLLVVGGAILSIVLPTSAGYPMSIGILGFLFAIRANIGDAQAQREAKLQTLKLAAQALDARDRYTESHSQRVSEVSVRLGQAMGLSSRELERLSVGGILHDIGKIGIPDAILNKRGPLSPYEWAIMRRHSDLGADMIQGHSALADVAPIVRHHHERWDGTGYPTGLSGAEIPLGGRILAVADSFDTITRIRVYRRTVMTTEQAVEDISLLARRWYDPAVVNALRAIYGSPPLPVARPAAASRAPAFTGGLSLLAANPRLRRLALASGISSLGDPLTTVATLVSAYAASHSPLLLAVIFMTKAAATLLFGGVLASLSDRFDRRRLIFVVELFRALALVATPTLLGLSLSWIFPVVFWLAAAEAVVNPAREAATPEVVRPGELRLANSVLGAVNTTGQVIGFPLAGLILLAGYTTRALFWLDAATFLAAGVVVLSIGALGGAVAGRRLTSGMREAWAVRDARPYLLLTGAGAFLVAMSLPSLVALAYQLSDHGERAYTLLQLSLSLGVVAGNVLLWRLGRVSSGGLMVVGLCLTGLLCLGIAASPWLAVTAGLLFVASVGNAWYVVANRTALQERGRSHNLGSLMATRFTVGNLAVIVGSGLGGWLVALMGPGYVYGLLGLGLIAVAGTVWLAGLGFGSERGPAAVPAAAARDPGAIGLAPPSLPLAAGQIQRAARLDAASLPPRD